MSKAFKKNTKNMQTVKRKAPRKTRWVEPIDPLTAFRTDAVLSLSSSIVQAWKARNPFGGVPESANDSGSMISSVLVSLNGPEWSQRRNVYSDVRLCNYLEAIYNTTGSLVKVYPKIVKYALDTTDRIVDLVRAVGYRGTFSTEWYLGTDQHYALLFMTRVWGANLKYNSQYLFSYFEGLEPPPQPETLVGLPGWLCYGRPGSALRRRCMGDSTRAREVRNTLLQGFKKSLLPLEEEDWRATLTDTKVSLTSPPPDMTDEVYAEMIRTGDELARRMPKFSVKSNYKLSASASTDRNRSDGGFAGYYLDKALGFGPFQRNENGKTRNNANGIIYRISPPYLVGDYREKGNWEMKLCYSRCPSTYTDVYEEYIGVTRSAEVTDVKVRVIPEPFKFRVISIGSFKNYACLKPYQQMLWKTLQNYECFSLTGSGADDLLFRTQSIVAKYWDVGMKFLSGDYKGATNYLSSYASRVLLGQWMKTQPEFLAMMERSLFSSVLNFEDAGKGVEGLVPGTEPQISFGEDDCVMQNGQLMGHPCSFPILCAVNAGICRMVLEKVWGRKFTLDDLPLLINGDDCLLIGPDTLLPEWRNRTREVGLYESVGKSYFSDKFAMINSRYLKVDAVPVGQKLNSCSGDYCESGKLYQAYVSEDVGYLNMGVFAGRKKGSNVDVEVGIGEEVDEKSSFLLWQSMAANYKQLNLRCKSLRIGLWSYLEKYRKFFKTGPCGKLPLFLPANQGGFGFNLEDGMKGEGVMPDFVDLDLVGDKAQYPKSFFNMKQEPKVMLGEAYFSGGMSSCYDDGDWYGFAEEAEKARRWYATKVNMSWMTLTADPEPKKDSEWTVTVVANNIRGGAREDSLERLTTLSSPSTDDNCVVRFADAWCDGKDYQKIFQENISSFKLRSKEKSLERSNETLRQCLLALRK